MRSLCGFAKGITTAVSMSTVKQGKCRKRALSATTADDSGTMVNIKRR